LAIRPSTCEVAAKRRGVSEKIVGKNLAARAKLIEGASEKTHMPFGGPQQPGMAESAGAARHAREAEIGGVGEHGRPFLQSGRM
jgi:hypothetical protein